MRRFGQVIHVKSEKLDYYKELHANPWPCVLEMIQSCNIRNYSIFLLDDHTLFAYYEFLGSDYTSDMQRMAADPCIQAWWKETDPCQESIAQSTTEWWLTLPEIFHCE